LKALLDLALHRFEVALDAVHANRQSVDQVEALGALGQDRRDSL
jgi:hypothetical protein